LAGAPFNGPRHICAFFNSREEEYNTVCCTYDVSRWVPPDEFLAELRERTEPANVV